MKKRVQKRTDIRLLTTAAILAALYVTLTWLSNAFGLASGVIQFRLSEALTVLVYFTRAAVSGVTIGCFLANLLTGACALDVVFGTLATFLGVLGGRLLRKQKWLVPIPTILSNMLIVPWVLRYGYGMSDAIWYSAITVGIGEVVCAGGLGLFLLHILKKRRNDII